MLDRQTVSLGICAHKETGVSYATDHVSIREEKMFLRRDATLAWVSLATQVLGRQCPWTQIFSRRTASLEYTSVGMVGR